MCSASSSHPALPPARHWRLHPREGRGGAGDSTPGGAGPARQRVPVRRSGRAVAAAAELRAALGQRLRDLGIATVTAEHPEVFTVEEMMPHVQHMKGGPSKNLFLKDKKKRGFWLVTVLHYSQVD